MTLLPLVEEAQGKQLIALKNTPDQRTTVSWVWRLLLVMLLFFFMVTMLGGYCGFRYAAKSTPAAPDFGTYEQLTLSRGGITAADGTILGEFASQWREFASYEEFPKDLIKAFLAAEDHEFFDHNGIYYKGTLRAASAVLSSGDYVQGGSTITQQLAKMYLSREKSLWRKIREAILARRIERLYSKEAILAVYLNEIYMGSGAYGVKAAAHRYFSKNLDELTLAECALLAGLARRPASDSPLVSQTRAIERRDEVLLKMDRHGFITNQQRDAAKAEPLRLRASKRQFTDTSPYFAEHVRRMIEEKYGEDALTENRLSVETTVHSVMDRAANENVQFGIRKQDQRQGYRGAEWHLDSERERRLFLKRSSELYPQELKPGHKYLGLVKKVSGQEAAVQIGEKDYVLPLKNARWAHPWSRVDATNELQLLSLRRILREGDVIWTSVPTTERGKFRDWFLAKGTNPRWRPEQAPKPANTEKKTVVLQLEQTPHPQGAIFTADHRNGYVLAMVGGEDFARSHYNRATQSCRPPGSTYKPIYYSAGLNLGYGFDTVLKDKPIELADIDTSGRTWIPENLGGTVDGEVSLEYSLVFSKNASSVDIFLRVGADNVEKWARRLGFTTEIIADRALALGASCTLLDELTNAFAVFARNGKKNKWVYVKRVIDANGKVLEDNTVPTDPWLTPEHRLKRMAEVGGRTVEQAIPARAAYLTTKLLAQVINRGFSSIVRRAGIPAAGKTGTSSDTMDMSFVGFTSHWITAVWYGDDLKVRPLGAKDAAYKTVVPLWARYMYEVGHDMPFEDIPWDVPEGVKKQDRGAHTKGVTGRRSPLIYIRKKKKPDEVPGVGATQ